MQSYIQSIKELKSPSFAKIRNIAGNSIAHLSDFERNKLWSQLQRGTALLNTHEQMCQYLFSYGNMHQAKLIDAYSQLPDQLFSDEYEIVDWGCGQGLGTLNLFDYLKGKDIENKVRRITLIEPSKPALGRAVLHTQAYLTEKNIVNGISDFFEKITTNQIESKLGLPVIHIFSNILDVAQIDLKHLANLVDKAVVSDNYIICVGPLNPTNQRIDAFYNYFDVPLLYAKETPQFNNQNWTYKCKLYKLESNEIGHLVPIEFYPTVQFRAAYELDAYKSARLKAKDDFFNTFSLFEVAAPFDIGASVYDDVNPILAVLNNIITRGLPTKASVFIEESFVGSFHHTKRGTNLGEISYTAENSIDYSSLTSKVQQAIDNEEFKDNLPLIALQELLTPIAIARFQKILVEAIITGHLDIEKDQWQVLVEEHDVPFAALALKDFFFIFYHLTQLSEHYSDLKLPKITLDVISRREFRDSPLHLDANVTSTPKSIHFKKTYDLVVDMAMLKKVNITKDSFSKYTCENNCYFIVRSTYEIKKKRTIYTSDLIHYKRLAEKNNLGEYIENIENKEHLTYFLQLLFRKDSFRPGQLPILDRALQNLPVIGLLPTGGGKSLTYQIAGLLQPGVTLVIDPLRSLMKDQYDGLLANGIDCCTYVNASVATSERANREKQMESSELLFIFVSPERLSILKFRERLKQMHEYNVYFSYGVIDEVHCVSEWGHDFRFSYLHLGRNLYNYVKAKDGEISLFGLTATASFDVLADVERELSGNGAFTLDSETIVRYENTNRLELQYKIETVKVNFAEDTFYDKKKLVDPSLPKPINLADTRRIFDSKKNYLKDYIARIPIYVTELQDAKNTRIIRNRFQERQNNADNLENELLVNMPDDFYKPNSEYKSAGIIFCPHVTGTGISVEQNTKAIKAICNDVGSFSGRDEDNNSMNNLELFRENKQPIMVATKAFGMGIDKPNVRFTVNMNYPSSLESFVQEAGRAGRDRKMALSIILMSDYEIAKIHKSYVDVTFPVSLIKNKWFKKNDLYQILDHYSLQVPEKYIEEATPNNDMVKLHCSKDNKMFGFNLCDTTCTDFNKCQLRKVSTENRGWYSEKELVLKLAEQGLPLNKKHLHYLSADYETVMYFFNASFKGDIIEKTFMHKLLSQNVVYVANIREDRNSNIEENRIPKEGFLSSLISANTDQEIVVFVPYAPDSAIDIAKAIYRMCCIKLIEDFTQDYSRGEYRISVRKRSEGAYYEGLKDFLLRYYTKDRAAIELDKARNYRTKVISEDPLIAEIHRCLAYLTEFVYDKISVKRKRAIDDMRNFCIAGSDTTKTWIERNEDLKDYIYYYFNSKFAKDDYKAENGEPYSLTEDTEGGKKSDPNILLKYLKVTDDEIVGVGTPIDNVKHLQGAVRLIRRSLTDSNPTLSLLNAFTLCYLGTKNNKILENELRQNYKDGMLEMADRMNYDFPFWNLFKNFNNKISTYIEQSDFEALVSETKLSIHGDKLNDIVEKYTNINE